MKKLGIVVFAALVAACGNGRSGASDEPPIERRVSRQQPSKGKAERALEAAGYTEIEITGYPVMQCSDSDSMFFNKGFRAKSPSGQIVEGAVCCGFFKGCTVRL